MEDAATVGGRVEPVANGAKKLEDEKFDPSRMVGIIKRKALIKELAAAYHSQCMASCKELLQIQRMWEKEQNAEAKMPDELLSSMIKPSKRRKR